MQWSFLFVRQIEMNLVIKWFLSLMDYESQLFDEYWVWFCIIDNGGMMVAWRMAWVGCLMDFGYGFRLLTTESWWWLNGGVVVWMGFVGGFLGRSNSSKCGKFWFFFFFLGGVGCDFGFTNDASIAPNGLNLALIWLDLH